MLWHSVTVKAGNLTLYHGLRFLCALVNAFGAKVQYVQVNHDEVEVAFEGITFQIAYGRVTVLADRSCPSTTCFLLQWIPGS